MKYVLLGLMGTLGVNGLLANSQVAPQTATVSEPESRVQIGGDYAYVHVKPHGETQTHGNLGGIQALYEYRALNRIYGAAALTWREGTTKGSGTKRTIADVDAQERIGYTFARDDASARIALFTGFGYRYLGEKVTTTGTPVRFNYNEFYVPVGFLLEGRINSTFSMGLNAQWMPQVYSSVVIKPMGGARWILKEQSGNFLVEAPMTICLSKQHNVSLIFTPFVESWHNGHTNATTETGVSLNVPKNTYFFGGANLNIAYSF